jgi:hypothetical protein
LLGPWTSLVLRTYSRRLILAVLSIVGLALALAASGIFPLSGDPELLYRPIKFELARALAAGRLPFWSDRFGIGVPLVAESHVAAFYPPNWLLYRLCDVHTAYRIAMWTHWLALCALTFVYARSLRIGWSGSALCALSFTLCGFQAAHIVHEPFNQLMPYLPLCLLLADCYITTSKLRWLAGLALAWGTQLTIGHFQIQMWTAGLVLLSGIYRVWAAGASWQRSLRPIALLCAGLFWGLLIAWVQLSLTWELTGVSGFVRPAHVMANFSFPPAHWAQFALPEVFLGVREGAGDTYWGRYGTVAAEACGYAGIVVWILAFIGAAAINRRDNFGPWRLLVPLSLALATMPGWWRDGFLLLMAIPGLGTFRAPGRYTLLTSLGLALLAGRGLDRRIAPARFWAGFILAVVIGAIAWAWSIYWTTEPDFRSSLLAKTLVLRFAAAGVVWILAIAAVIAWRQNWTGAWAPLGIAFFELTVLFFVGPVNWVWDDRSLVASPVLYRLAQMRDVGLVAGRLQNLPVEAGKITAYPYLGITAPPPNYLLEHTGVMPAENDSVETRWFRRFGVTHGVWGSADSTFGTNVIERIDDPVLDRLMATLPPSLRGGLGPWALVKVPGAFPPAWIAREVHEAASWKELFARLAANDAADQAWFEPGDAPRGFPTASATSAQVKSWDGTTAIVEHDGPCILIVRRTFYPGWSYRLDDAPLQPVHKVNSSMQGVPLTGSGRRRIRFQYHPRGLRRGAAVSLGALASALFVLFAAGFETLRSGKERRVSG